MILTVFILLGVAALVLTLLHAVQRAPLWPSVLLLAIAELLRSVPLGR